MRESLQKFVMHTAKFFEFHPGSKHGNDFLKPTEFDNSVFDAPYSFRIVVFATKAMYERERDIQKMETRFICFLLREILTDLKTYEWQFLKKASNSASPIKMELKRQNSHQGMIRKQSTHSAVNSPQQQVEK